MYKRIYWAVTACAFFLCQGMAAAQESADTGMDSIPSHPALSDPFFLALGAYYPRSSSSALLTRSEGGAGVGVDFEDTLGLSEREATWNALARWRFTKRWRVELEYFSLKRSASKTLEAEVEWGDNTYPIGATVDSEFDVSDTRLAVGYSFFKRKDKEIGVGLGLHVTELKASINASGVGAEAADVLAPLPVANLYALFALTNEWALTTRMDWLSLSYDAYEGEIRSVGIDVIYQPFRNVGFGFGGRTLTIDVAIDSSEWRGSANMIFQGPQAFVNVTF